MKTIKLTIGIVMNKDGKVFTFNNSNNGNVYWEFPVITWDQSINQRKEILSYLENNFGMICRTQNKNTRTICSEYKGFKFMFNIMICTLISQDMVDTYNIDWSKILELEEQIYEKPVYQIINYLKSKEFMDILEITDIKEKDKHSNKTTSKISIDELSFYEDEEYDEEEYDDEDEIFNKIQELEILKIKKKQEEQK